MVPTVAATPSSADTDGLTVQPSGLFQQSAPANNTTVKHENPDETNEDGDLSGVRGYLAQQLANRLTQSAVEIDQGQYEQSKSLLGDEFAEQYGKYVDVAGDTEDTGAAEQLNETRTSQQEFATTTQEFQETYEEYQRAKENGNEQRARELARELNELEDRSNRTAKQLDQSYAGLSNQTGANTSSARQSIEDVQTNVSNIEAEVVEAELTQTSLVLQTETRAVSFQNPLNIEGRLMTTNGSALANEEITLATGAQTLKTTTAADGSFSITYRPITLPTNTSSISVRYVPESTSIYTGSNSSLPVSVTQSTGRIQFTTVPSQSAFGDQVDLSGRVAVESTRVPNAPVRVELGGTSLGVVQTNDAGEFSLQTPLPAGVSVGDQPLTADIAVPNRAVAAQSRNESVEINLTNTTLSINATQRESDQQVAVSGHLETSDGQPIRSQPVALRVNGTSLTTVRTGPNGEFQRAISIPQQAIGDATGGLALSARFSGAGTNLQPASARTRIGVRGAGSQSGPAIGVPGIGSQSGPEIGVPGVGSQPPPSTVENSFISQFTRLPLWMQAGSAVIILLIGLVFGWFLRHRDSTNPESTATSNSSETASTHTNDGAESSEMVPETLLTSAKAHLEANETDAAVSAAYGYTRSRFASLLEVPAEGTHWEFITACQRAAADTDIEPLRRMTEWYEHAAYGRESASESTAQDALNVASALSHQSEDDSGSAHLTDGGKSLDNGTSSQHET